MAFGNSKKLSFHLPSNSAIRMMIKLLLIINQHLFDTVATPHVVLGYKFMHFHLVHTQVKSSKKTTTTTITESSIVDFASEL